MGCIMTEICDGLFYEMAGITNKATHNSTPSCMQYSLG